DPQIAALKELRPENSEDEVSLSQTAVHADYSQAKEGTLENLLIWARNKKNDVRVKIDGIRTRKGWNFPSYGGEKCKKGVVRKEGSFWCQVCDKAVEYPVLRFRLELDVSDKTAYTVVVMFDEPATELVKCSADSLAAANEDVGVDLEDLDEGVTCGMDDGQADGKDSYVLDKRKKKRYIETIDNDSLNMDTPIPSISNILHKSFIICSRTNITRDRKGSRHFQTTPMQVKNEKQLAFTSRHPFNTSELSRSCIKFMYQSGKTVTLLQNFSEYNNMSLQLLKMLFVFERPQTCASTRLPKRATLTFAGVDETTVAGLITMLDNTSAVAQAFRMARYWCHSHESVNFELCILSEHTFVRQYNALTVPEVAALITNDFGDGLPSMDIVVGIKDGGPIRISELHPLYMAMQYPLLFPYGEDWFHEKIPYHTNRGTRKIKRGYVSMKEYYA
ncbi:DNA helicase PIF1, ATP-dependent, partial [Tanacetum coccineum]